MTVLQDKPELDENLLLHYGIKGMKWGRRRGKGVTGVGRARGAAIDRNDRTISRIKNAQKGAGLRRDRWAMAIDRKLLGKETAGRIATFQLKELNAQNARLKSGKVLFRDRLDVLMNTTPLDFVMSNRPK